MAQKTSPSQKKRLNITGITSLFLIVSFSQLIDAQDFGVPSRTTVGVGARAFAMGNNYVAVSDDATAMFWNPAGLAFTPVREFQVSLSGHSHLLDTEFKSGIGIQRSEADRQRIHFNNAAYLRALPTNRGGFSLAFGYQSPYLIDDLYKYSVREVSGSRTDYKYYSFGQMSLWTAAFGLQVAEDIGVGGAISLISGRSRMNLNEDYYSALGAVDSIYSGKIKQGYLGADVRLGFMASLLDKAKIGMRVEIPQYMIFNEEFDDEFISGDTIITYFEDNSGTLKTSFSLAFGISYRFPFMLLSSEISTRSPIPDADEESYYSHWKLKAGGGVEIPLFIESLLLRGGYSWQEFDRYPLLIEYEYPPPLFDSEIDLTVDKDEHLITAGLSYMTKNWFAFDVSYGYRFWELSKGNTLSEDHSSHRVVTSFAIRF